MTLLKNIKPKIKKVSFLLISQISSKKVKKLGKKLEVNFLPTSQNTPKIMVKKTTTFLTHVDTKEHNSRYMISSALYSHKIIMKIFKVPPVKGCIIPLCRT